MHNEDVVRGSGHIELDPVDACCESGSERADGVLDVSIDDALAEPAMSQHVRPGGEQAVSRAHLQFLPVGCTSR